MVPVASLDRLEETLRILHIEDNIDDVLLMEISLRKIFGEQLVLVSVNSLADAKRVLYQQPFHLALLDLSLPDAHGLAGLESLRSSFPHQAVVVVTGMHDDELGLQAIRTGAQDYLTKGQFTRETVLRVIRYSVERNKIATDLSKRAQHDTLTGLANRSGFHSYLNIAIAQAIRKQQDLAVLFIDLDDFKTINDTLGHEAGDHFLQGIARAFQGALRSSDFLARLGGDEFTVIIPCDHRGLGEPQAVAEKLIHALDSPIKIPDGQAINARCSIGVALWEADSGNTHQEVASIAKHLVNQADAAMYQAKSTMGSSYQFCDGLIRSIADDKSAKIQEIQQAWESQAFCLYYQPIFGAIGKTLRAVETKLRWQSPLHGVIDPAAYLELLEDTPLLTRIGHWVIKESVAQFTRWRESGLLDERSWISIDISNAHFLMENLTNEVQDILSTYSVPPHHLRLELKGRTLMKESALAQLNRLKQLGISIAIDHFGTEYYSMQYLKTHAVDALVIDRSYVRSYFENHESQASTRAMINLGKTLNKAVVAEGIDCEALAAAMRDLGCDYLQGDYLAPPMPETQIAEYAYQVK